MKNFKSCFGIIAVCALLFSSCSKEEGNSDSITEKATLSFATVLNDLVANKASVKQAIADIPWCSDDAPTFVQVVLSQDGVPVVGTEDDPLVVNVNPNAADYDGDGVEEYFTDESASLELEAGTYTLEHFVVLNAEEEVIWVAPVAGSELAGFVGNSLPFDITLGNGVKKYVDVEVLCFDNRLVNEYGYLFFDIENQRAIEFCVFGNSCDENGRHSPAHFRIDIWTFSGNSGSPRGTALFDPENPYVNVVGVNEDGDAFAEPVCLPLPNNEGLDSYYGEIYVLDPENPDDEGRLVVSGVFTDADVRKLYTDGDSTDYYHFREDCEMGNTGF